MNQIDYYVKASLINIADSLLCCKSIKATIWFCSLDYSHGPHVTFHAWDKESIAANKRFWLILTKQHATAYANLSMINTYTYAMIYLSEEG